MDKMKNVDIAIQVYGKPYQTLATLKSLMLHCGDHIDKIYFILEKKQPNNDEFDFVLKQFNNIIFFTPEYFLFISPPDKQKYEDEDYRYSLRYQYAWEKTDKKYLFITHNDILYKGDIIREMLNLLSKDEYAGIGQIVGCGNCPAFFAKKCDGDKFLEYNPSYAEVIELIEKYPPVRGQQHNSFLNKEQPMPLPECKINECACLLNLKRIKHEIIPYGSIDPFGTYVGIDLNNAWFRELNLKGYKFKNFNIYQYCKHGWGQALSGHLTLFNLYHYAQAEGEAFDYLMKYFPESLLDI